MRHYQTEGNTKGVSPLTQQVFSILDSRIQFIDFQVQRYFKHCTSQEKSTDNSPSNYCGPSDVLQVVDDYEQLLIYTEELQQDLKRLQTLKAWLKEETVQYILDLLTNNKYLTIPDDQLDYFLRQKALLQYRA